MVKLKRQISRVMIFILAFFNRNLPKLNEQTDDKHPQRKLRIYF